jgi:hypothetical protein
MPKIIDAPQGKSRIALRGQLRGAGTGGGFELQL